MRSYCLGNKKKKSATFSVLSVAFGGKISVYHALRRVIFFQRVYMHVMVA